MTERSRACPESLGPRGTSWSLKSFLRDEHSEMGKNIYIRIIIAPTTASMSNWLKSTGIIGLENS